MIFIIFSIFLSSYLTLAFKVWQRLNISSFQGIVFNYLTCVVVGSIVNGHYPIHSIRDGEKWLPWSLLMGSMFIALFNLIAYVTRKMGVAIASVTNKLSLIVPFLFATYFYGDSATWVNYVGIILALAAVALTCWPHKQIDDSSLPVIHGPKLFIPIILFIGSGMLDTLITYTERTFLNVSNKDAYLILTFSVAGLIGIMILLYQFVTKKDLFSWRAVLAGIAIGIPNYFSIQTLMIALDQYAGRASFVMPVVNIGIVLFSTIVAFYVFREKLSKLNWTGIFLSVIAILLLSYR